MRRVTPRRRIALCAIAIALLLVAALVLHKTRARNPEQGTVHPGAVSRTNPELEGQAEVGAEPVGEVDGDALVALSLRDLATGEPVSMASVEVLTRLGRSTLTADSSGILRLPSSQLKTARFEPAGGLWHIPRYSNNREIRRTRTIWLYRALAVRVVVEYEQPPVNKGAPWVIARMVGPTNRSAADRRGDTPWSRSWAVSHGIDRLQNRLKPDAEARVFSGSMPYMKFTAIAVGREGYRTTVLDIPALAASADRVELVAHLEPAARLSGQLLDEGRMPVGGAVLQAYIVLEGTRSLLNPARASFTTWAVGTRTSKDDQVYVNLGCKVPVAADGTFQLDLPTVGRVVLIAHAPGRKPIWFEAGASDRDIGNAQLQFDPHVPDSRVVIKYSEADLGGATLHIGDIDDGALQTSFRTNLDEKASVPGEYFVSGREYWLIVTFKQGAETKSVDGLIRWDQRATIEMDNLEGDLDAFRASR